MRIIYIGHPLPILSIVATERKIIMIIQMIMPLLISNSATTVRQAPSKYETKLLSAFLVEAWMFRYSFLTATANTIGPKITTLSPVTVAVPNNFDIFRIGCDLLF